MKCLRVNLLFVFLLGCKVDVDVEKENPLEGTTWEMISAKYTWGDSTYIRPTSEFHRGLSIWGKTHTAAVWQDTSKQESFFCGHAYTIEGDTITFNIKLFADPRGVDRSFKVKYELKENQLILSGIIPRKKWENRNHDMNLYEVWKTID